MKRSWLLSWAILSSVVHGEHLPLQELGAAAAVGVRTLATPPPPTRNPRSYVTPGPELRKHVKKLYEELDHDDYDIREKADRTLAKLLSERDTAWPAGIVVESFILQHPPKPEARRRLEILRRGSEPEDLMRAIQSSLLTKESDRVRQTGDELARLLSAAGEKGPLGDTEARTPERLAAVLHAAGYHIEKKEGERIVLRKEDRYFDAAVSESSHRLRWLRPALKTADGFAAKVTELTKQEVGARWMALHAPESKTAIPIGVASYEPGEDGKFGLGYRIRGQISREDFAFLQERIQRAKDGYGVPVFGRGSLDSFFPE